MKKNKSLLIILLAIIIISLLVCSFIVFKAFNNKIIKISRNMEIENFECQTLSEKDTHSGFLGDGDYFAKMKCSSIGKLSSNWKELPLSNSLREVTEMQRCDEKSCHNIYEKYQIPNIVNGYYLFLDRHSDSNNKYDDTNINKRSSYNLSLYMLDNNTNIIYYYELDT